MTAPNAAAHEQSSTALLPDAPILNSTVPNDGIADTATPIAPLPHRHEEAVATLGLAVQEEAACPSLPNENSVQPLIQPKYHVMDMVINGTTPLRVALALQSHTMPFQVVPLLPIGEEYTAADGSVRKADDRVPIPDRIGRKGAPVSLGHLFKKYKGAGVGVRLGQPCSGVPWLIEVVVKEPKWSTAELKRLFPRSVLQTTSWDDRDGRHLLFFGDDRLAPLASGGVDRRLDGLVLRVGGRGADDVTDGLAVLPPTQEVTPSGSPGDARRWNFLRWQLHALPERFYAELGLGIEVAAEVGQHEAGDPNEADDGGSTVELGCPADVLRGADGLPAADPTLRPAIAMTASAFHRDESGSTATVARKLTPAGRTSADSQSSPEDGASGIAKQDEADDLPRLAERINSTYREGVMTVLDHARRLGELLLRAKRQVGHGGFTRWIEENCQFSIESARNYMRVAANWGELDEPSAGKRQCVTGLSLTAGLNQIARPRGRGQAKVAGESTGNVVTSRLTAPEYDRRPTPGETTTCSEVGEPDDGTAGELDTIEESSASEGAEGLERRGILAPGEQSRPDLSAVTESTETSDSGSGPLGARGDGKVRTVPSSVSVPIGVSPPVVSLKWEGIDDPAEQGALDWIHSQLARSLELIRQSFRPDQVGPWRVGPLWAALEPLRRLTAEALLVENPRELGACERCHGCVPDRTTCRACAGTGTRSVTW